MTPEQLDAIQARVDAATEGPWETDPQWQDPATGFVSYGVFAQDDTGLAGYDDPLDKDDAEFIAHARTDVLHLLTHVWDLEAAIERVRELHQSSGGHNPKCQCGVPAGSGANCVECGDVWPCPTAAALTATVWAA